MDLTKIWTKENVNFTKRTLGKLENDRHKTDIFQLIDDRITNIWLVLAYLAKVIKPHRYMELGVRRGYSMAIVGARRTSAELIGFDLWIPGYASEPNPGPKFVRDEMEKVGHKGLVVLVTGDCAKTVPMYDNSILTPIILADAGHTTEDVLRDIKNCRRLLAPGGYLIIDDLHAPDVMKAWEMATFGSGDWTWQKDRVGIIRKA